MPESAADTLTTPDASPGILLSDELSDDLPVPMTRGEVVVSSREIITEGSLRRITSLDPLDDEIAIAVHDSSIRIMRGRPEQIQRMPDIKEKPLFKIHSHPGLEGDQPSIADLNSAEIDQIYDGNPHVRFFIITSRGITEYRLPPTLIARLQEKDEEFREYYIAWLREKFGDHKPDGKTISTQFNLEHMTSTFYPWESEQSAEIVEAFRTQRALKDAV